ncbi:MAG: helix-turn-helix domain-containing protein [Opitutaceae bacterium]
MPNLSIIPAAAVMDRDLTHTQLRVLCAIGVHTDKLGGNVWTSVKTLADEAGVSERTVQGACQALTERGYLRITTRSGRTNLYEVVLHTPPQPAAPPQQLVHPTPAIAAAPKRPQLTTPKLPGATKDELRALEETYPERPEPIVWPPVVKELNALIREGVPFERIRRAAARYAVHCELNQTDAKYVKTLHRWLADGMWRTYDVLTVHGRTREEWKRSGQDVLEFDRLATASVVGSPDAEARI